MKTTKQNTLKRKTAFTFANSNSRNAMGAVSTTDTTVITVSRASTCC